MIGCIRGMVILCDWPHVLIDVNGLGYEVNVPSGTVLPDQLGQEVMLYTQFIVREDAQLLFGFKDLATRLVFRDLIKLSGIGPKVALVVLSSVSVVELRDAVYQQDTSRLLQIKGIGKRVAEKMLVELKNKVDHWDCGEMEARVDVHTSHRADALEALLALGYPKRQAEQALDRVEAKADDLTQWVRLALQQLATYQQEDRV